jgi:hypothetical protein
MTDLITEPSEVRFTLEITRAETGLTETVEMVGHIVSVEPEVIEGENECL